MRIRLADDDRERLGIEQEWIEAFSPTRFMLADAEALEGAGYDPDDFLQDLAGHPVIRDGEPVMDPEVDDDGNEVLVDGKPKLVERWRIATRTRRALLWLAVRRAGSKVSFADFDIQLNELRYEADEVAAVGKADTAARPSRRRGSATGSRSSKSSASSRGRSTS